MVGMRPDLRTAMPVRLLWICIELRRRWESIASSATASASRTATLTGLIGLPAKARGSSRLSYHSSQVGLLVVSLWRQVRRRRTMTMQNLGIVAGRQLDHSVLPFDPGRPGHTPVSLKWNKMQSKAEQKKVSDLRMDGKHARGVVTWKADADAPKVGHVGGLWSK
ncbi:hypothetical protein CONLIGDRAFT_279044 [Coniochaeta ligniaria NRRL 30616]|uniref:Uncharacterized protein n=1 Tax=Coniochaeta ligniaria NRRL 30616 TaxID=1408157 RepID=A0A1J7I3Z4_9PEZI|nr:hypothetical protein CONLIGDRAFT_279044 [Coniochaeta ligniaria NRRL 30616]